MWRSSDPSPFALASCWRVGWPTSGSVSACAILRRTGDIFSVALSARGKRPPHTRVVTAVRHAAWLLLLMGSARCDVREPGLVILEESSNGSRTNSGRPHFESRIRVDESGTATADRQYGR